MRTETLDKIIREVRELASTREKAGNYEVVSVRKLIDELGFNPQVRQMILHRIAERGFTYCLDHTIESTFYDGNKMVTEYPDWQVCYWDPSQIRSRLDALRS